MQWSSIIACVKQYCWTTGGSVTRNGSLIRDSWASSIPKHILHKHSQQLRLQLLNHKVRL